MRKKLIATILITVSYLATYSQIIFENGYFINESNQKINCFIKNVDWKNNPVKFEYKLNENDTVQIATIRAVKEFGINNVSKYIRAKTNIDRSPDQIDEMSFDRHPNFQEEVLFLKVLIEGKASLLQYVDGNLIRFFYKKNDSPIQQLVYKKYMDNFKIIENNHFKQQLFLLLKCNGIESNDLERLEYKTRDLERIFLKYNECTGSKYVNYDPKGKKDLFNITVRPRIYYGSVTIQNSLSNFRDTDFEKKIGAGFGVEAEFILPYNKNTWGITTEPTFHYFKSEQSKETSQVWGGILVSRIEYKSIELPIGIRHYFYYNDEAQLFVNVSIVFDFDFHSTIEFLRQDDSMISTLEIQSRPNMALGIGYKYKDTYSLELRYSARRNILSDYVAWNSAYRNISIVMGYSLF